MTREITEDDLRMPEYRGIKLENLERRDDGRIVRKDRWELTCRRIAGQMGLDGGYDLDELPGIVGTMREFTPTEAMLTMNLGARERATARENGEPLGDWVEWLEQNALLEPVEREVPEYD